MKCSVTLQLMYRIRIELFAISSFVHIQMVGASAEEVTAMGKDNTN